MAGTGDEIWVAKGTYTPDAGGSNTPGNRTATFQLKPGVALYGGFAGTETLLSERILSAAAETTNNETILSGDLNGDDAGFTNNGENSYRVVTGSSADSSAVIDGFTIQGGNANGSFFDGAGMFIENGSPTVINCAFSGNSASDEGGGIYNSSSSPRFTNCTFSNNNAYKGGGIRNCC